MDYVERAAQRRFTFVLALVLALELSLVLVYRLKKLNNFKNNLLVFCEKLGAFALKFTPSFTEFLFTWITLRELLRAFHLFWNADETGPPWRKAGGDGFFLFKHIGKIALLCVDF